MSTPEAAVLDYIVGSFGSCPVVVRLLQDGLIQLNVLAVFGDAVFDPVLNIEWIVGVSRVVRSDWYDHLLAAGSCQSRIS
ncbi:hypothetical protein SAMN04487948_13817 [Halogranum amylolyticum]|uniref:Uncharacterized protein n=1 Tax=Halogranum amylolyticum TaxID=660520 RepID=A0A1H8WQW6_9EURY|nr:hypothetical protein SAMN04487948_13817 [Halogranum amylolyticum]